MGSWGNDFDLAEATDESLRAEVVQEGAGDDQAMLAEVGDGAGGGEVDMDEQPGVPAAAAAAAVAAAPSAQILDDDWMDPDL